MNQEQYKKLKDYIVNFLDTPFMQEDAINISKIFEEDSFTIDQIRKAGAEGEINSIDVEHLISILKPNKKQPSQDDDLDYLRKYPIKEPSIKEDIEKMAEKYANEYWNYDTGGCARTAFKSGYKAALQSKSLPINEVKQPIQDKVSDDELIEKFRDAIYGNAAFIPTGFSLKCAEIAKQYSNTKLEELEKKIDSHINWCEESIDMLTNRDSPISNEINTLPYKQFIRLLKSLKSLK